MPARMKGVLLVITRNTPGGSPDAFISTPPVNDTHHASPNSSATLQEQRAIVKQIRHEMLLRYRPVLQQGSGPIRVMARMVADVERSSRERGIPEAVITSEVINRTIGDVDLRRIMEVEGEPGGPNDYRQLADEMGIALPGEQLSGFVATGKTYLWLRDQMLECERLLLQQGIDLRLYDIQGTGNTVMRGWLARDWQQQWGLPIAAEQVFLSLGAMDGIDKTLKGLRQLYEEQGVTEKAVLFPEPGFGVPEQQARSYGYRLHRVATRPEHHFKLTAAQLDEALSQNPDIRLIYLTVTNNPTTLAFKASEIKTLYAVLQRYREQGQRVLVLADLAYIGTGQPEADRARMAAFNTPDILRNTIFVNSYSKTLSLTGDRLGWVTIGDAELAPRLAPGWSNSMASLPADWQLRFMAYFRLIQEKPFLVEKMRRFYRLRRQRFIAQLQRLNCELDLFEQIYLDDDATVYNWSKMRPGQDAFTLFEKTGIAGVPGSGFGYSDEYVRFSIGVIPMPRIDPDLEP